MKTNNFLKDKNKLLMIIPIVLGGLFLYVFLFTTHHQRKLRKMKKKGKVYYWSRIRKQRTKLSIRLKPINKMKEKRRRNKESWMNHR